MGDLKDDLVGSGDARPSPEALLETYRLFVEMADNISARRQSANNYFLSINTAIIAAIGYTSVKSPDKAEIMVVSVGVAGAVLCYLWFRLVKSYKDMNTGKFKVIHELEEMLGIRPYAAEWKALGEGENTKLYKPFTDVEMKVPWVFLVLHFAIIAVQIAGWLGLWSLPS